MNDPSSAAKKAALTNSEVQAKRHRMQDDRASNKAKEIQVYAFMLL